MLPSQSIFKESVPVNTNLQGFELPAILVLPVPLKYNLPPTDDIAVPFHVFQVDLSVEYSSVPSQFLVVLYVFRVKSSFPMKLNYGVIANFNTYQNPSFHPPSG